VDRFGKTLAKGAAALAIGVMGVSAFASAAHAVDGCTATVEVVNDAGQVVSQNVVPCSGGMQNGHAYLYDTHGNYLGQVYNEPAAPDPPLEPVPPADPVPARSHSSHGSTGSSHSSSSGSRSTSRRGTAAKPRPATMQSPGSQSAVN
jgi:hypothetical protein